MEDSSMPSIDPEVLAIRESVKRNTQWASDQIPWPEGMKESSHTAISYDGTEIEVRHLVPKVVLGQQPASRPNRAVVFAFGGGFVGGSVDIFRGFLAIFSELSETQLFAPAWRIAPENSWSDGVEDVYATVQWLQKNAESFNVDPARILVAGQSAGATLAAGVTHLARDRLLAPPLAAQVLRYAALDDTSVLEPGSSREKYLSWTAKQSEIAWTARMGGVSRTQRNIDNTPPYAAPSRALHMESLPPAHIGVGDYDIFRDENQTYSDRLRAAGVEVEFFLYPESPHGFDGMPGSVQGRIMWDNEAAFVKKF
jgi:acetyl esterase/lipase